MIKNFETYINEDYFSKLASRKETGNVRNELKIKTNINEIEPVDVFAKSGRLWASTTLSTDDGILFNYDDALNVVNSPDIKRAGWRLPTAEEFLEDFDGILPLLTYDDDISTEPKMWTITSCTKPDKWGDYDMGDSIWIPLDPDTGYDESFLWTTSSCENDVFDAQYSIHIVDNDFIEHKEKTKLQINETAQILLVKDK